MKKVKFLIIGAGIGGLSAGAELKQAGEDFLIIEKSKSLPLNLANGLHYLHSKDLGTPFDFQYKTCVMSEQIWDTRTNKFSKSATIPEMFEYSKKISESIRHPSSILDPGKRLEVYVPESNNMNDLLMAYHNYIGKDKFAFKEGITKIDTDKKIAKFESRASVHYDYLITTAPLNKFYQICGKNCKYELKQKELFIANYRTTNIVSNWLIVLYMSDPKFPPYRITAFNGLISMESMKPLTHEDEIVIKYLIGDLFDYDLESKQEYKWETGRIFGLERKDREEMIESFNECGIFPLGRYGTWNGKETMDTTILSAKNIIKSLI